MITNGITECEPPNGGAGSGTAWVAEAREIAEKWARNEGFAAEVIDNVRLIVSELVTNAVQHAAGTEGVLLRLYRGDAGAVVEVWDAAGDRRPELRAPNPDHEHGRGLAIVDALALQWDVNPLSNGGKAVWAAIGEHS